MSKRHSAQQGELGASGTYGIFRLLSDDDEGIRQRRTLLVAHSVIDDQHGGREWSIGVYESTLEVGSDDAWKNVIGEAAWRTNRLPWRQ
jgi:hypothetical protein